MRIPLRLTACAVAATAPWALVASAVGHQTVADRGTAVTMHVQPDDAPLVGKPATIVVVKVAPPKGGRFTFRACTTCRLRVADASGHVLLSKRVASRTSFTFPKPAAYEITYSGSYRAKNRRIRTFRASFAIRAYSSAPSQ
jgi:hypothetical protein